jgi:hypothetical protein
MEASMRSVFEFYAGSGGRLLVYRRPEMEKLTASRMCLAVLGLRLLDADCLYRYTRCLEDSRMPNTSNGDLFLNPPPRL